MFTFCSQSWCFEDCNHFQIEVVEGNWGETKIKDVHCLLENVAQNLLKYFDSPFSAKIYVECHPHRSAAEVQ
jgi:hypothetical protein